MDMDMPDAAPAAPSTSAPAAPPAPRRRVGGVAILLALLAAGAAGYAVWRSLDIEHISADVDAKAAAQRAEIDALNRRVDQSNRDRDLLRQRLDDVDGVNKSLREEVLGVTERARVLEDAVANLAEKRLSGHDALLLDEAEMLLRLGQERYDLFADASASAQAYALADEALSATDDPAFATVRETLAVERKALTDQRVTNASTSVAELEHLRAGLATLPLQRDAVDADAAKQNDSRFWQVMGRFVRVTHGADAPSGGRDRGMARSLVSLDLRSAEAAQLARDAEAFRASVQRARATAADALDAQTPAVKEFLSALDRLAAAPAPVAPVSLGAALKELRNLRSTHRLQRDAAPKPAAAAQ